MNPPWRPDRTAPNVRSATGSTAQPGGVGSGWGGERVFYNVGVAWIAHGVTLVLGFVMPRLISETIGYELLGVWDLAWSLLSYLGLSGLGAASAVTHFVARFRAEGDPAAIRETVATAFWCQLLGAAVLAVGFFLTMSGLPRWMPETFAAMSGQLWAIGILLGLAILVAVVAGVVQGALNGYHRSGISEWLTVGMDVTLAVGMVLAIVLGAGVVGLAIATLATRVLFETARLVLALRICPGMALSPRLIRAERVRSVFEFGTKTTIGIVQEALVHLVTRFLLIASAGPIALACYSRYATLVRQIGRGIERMAYPLPPIASRLATLRGSSSLSELSGYVERLALLLTMPLITTFAVFGDIIVELWMGPDFVVPGISAVLAVMALAHADREIAARVLAGMNAHGRIALFCLVTSTVTFLTLLWLLHPLDPLNASVLVAGTMTLGVYLPHYLLGCRRLGVSPTAHFRSVYARPLACNAGLLIGLLLVREHLERVAPLVALVTVSGLFAALALIYWHFAFDDVTRTRIRSRLLGHGR